MSSTTVATATDPATAPRAQFDAFCDALDQVWGQTDGDVVVVSAKAPGGAFRGIGGCDPLERDDLRALIKRANPAVADVYLSTQMLAADTDLTGGRRGTAADVTRIVTVCADVDLTGGEHAADSLPTQEEAEAIMASCPLGRPTILVHSGGGLHYWWRLRRPMPNDAATRSSLVAVKGWLADAFAIHGFAVDSHITANPALVLRIPGTFNHKGPTPVPVRILAIDPGVDVDLGEVVMPEGPAQQKPVSQVKRAGVPFNADRGTLAALLRAAGATERADGTWSRPGSASGDTHADIVEDADADGAMTQRVRIFSARWIADWGLDASGASAQLRAVDVLANRWCDGNIRLAWHLVEAFQGDVDRILEAVEGAEVAQLRTRLLAESRLARMTSNPRTAAIRGAYDRWAVAAGRPCFESLLADGADEELISEQLLREHGFPVSIPALAAATIVPVTINASEIAERAHQELVGEVSRLLVETPHPTLPGLPLWLRVRAGATDASYLVAVDFSGRPAIFTPDDRSCPTIAHTVAQPGQQGKAGFLPLAGWPREIARGAVDAFLASEPVTVTKIVSEPIVAPDGRVISDPGVHAVGSERILLAMGAEQRAWWRENYSAPTGRVGSDQAQVAMEYLVAEVLHDFPFASDGDRVRSVARMLSDQVVTFVPTRPIWGYGATDKGTGKGLLTEVARIVASGDATYQSIGCTRAEDEEIRKVAVAAQLAGQRFLHCDDVPRDATVNSMILTELATAADGVHAYRVLGGNQRVAIAGMTIDFCGNNYRLGGDLARRVVPILLQHRGAGLAHQRTGWRHADLKGWVRASRGQILAALHTILAAGLQSGTDRGQWRCLGGYEEWKRVVLGSLAGVTLGGVPCDDLFVDGLDDATATRDEETDEWADFMLAWASRIGFGGPFLSAKQLLERLGQVPDLPTPLVPGFQASPTRVWGIQLGSRAGTRVLTGDGLLSIEARHDRKAGNSYRLFRHDS